MRMMNPNRHFNRIINKGMDQQEKTSDFYSEIKRNGIPGQDVYFLETDAYTK